MRVLLLASVFVLAGCAEPTVDEAEVFVFDYEIVDLGSGEKTANPGQHCGDAQRTEDGLKIWLWPDEERPDGPWLAIFPTLPDAWHVSMADEPFKTAFPATVDPRVPGDDTVLGELAWAGEGGSGTLRVDGEAVSLPHAWSVHGDDWRADATLSAWEGPLEVGRYTGLCD